ncbi:MAG: tRNA pseudouridine(55) synthase TruB [Chloroflexi bacterium]|nr:tRNA pseudouridine(55) synthase TruB [Chloroflexota bacterium]
MPFGILNVHKPVGPTSHDMVAGVRRGTRERRVGHAGTLDPLAEGVLILAVGEATRLLEYLTTARKRYTAHITLGKTTPTYDAEGTITAEAPVAVTRAELDAALEGFRGAIEQVPPVYSAVKVAGKSAHARVRAGEDVELEPRSVTIYDLHVDSYDPPQLVLSLTVSAGTYIRSLAHDLGQALGCGGMLAGLVRTAVGGFTLADAVEWAALQAAFEDDTWERYLLSAARALPDLPLLHLDAASLEEVSHGRPLVRQQAASAELALAAAPDGSVVAVLEAKGQRWQPKKVLRQQINAALKG